MVWSTGTSERFPYVFETVRKSPHPSHKALNKTALGILSLRFEVFGYPERLLFFPEHWPQACAIP